MGMALARTPVDPAHDAAEAALDAVWGRVTTATEPWFRVGIEAATLAGMAWGFRRAREDVLSTLPSSGDVPRGTFEAVAIYREPPGTPAGFATRTIDGRELPDLTGTPFGLAAPAAIEQARLHAAEMVRGVDDVTRDRLRHLVTDARANGQSGAVLAGRIRSEFPHMAAARPQAHIRDRAHLIAVTETAGAYERGQRLVAERSAAAGLVMVKSWLTVGDASVDDVCNENEDADELPMADPFPSGHENPPAHPGCRCTSQYRALSSAERGLTPPAPTPEPDGIPDATETDRVFRTGAGWWDRLTDAAKGLVARFHEHGEEWNHRARGGETIEPLREMEALVDRPLPGRMTVYRGAPPLPVKGGQVDAGPGVLFNTTAKDYAVSFGRVGATAESTVYELVTDRGLIVPDGFGITGMIERAVLTRAGRFRVIGERTESVKAPFSSEVFTVRIVTVEPIDPRVR